MANSVGHCCDNDEATIVDSDDGGNCFDSAESVSDSSADCCCSPTLSAAIDWAFVASVVAFSKDYRT